VGSHTIRDGDAEGGTRVCQPGDIALIAPVGTSLWIYEAALEQAGLPIATQAGKGAFRRQEVLDLIALARVLADGRDTLALGALLRGPLVGLTEEQLLDCVQALPRDPERPDRIPALNLSADPDALPEPVAAHTLRVLKGMRARARTTTPFELMAEAVEEMRVRPILERRHPGAAERALANVDLFLELARPYAVRGLKAFARDMRDNWENSANQSEGRPDAQQEAVQVITMHSAKGLEWPVVIPVNAVGAPQSESGPQLRRSDDTLHMPVARTVPPPRDYKATLEKNERERRSERVRLWYVTCTRAAELLVLPNGDADTDANAWDKIVDLGVGALPGLDTCGYAPGLPERSAPATNHQDAETFRAEAERVAAAHPTIRRRTPSRHEADAGDGEADVVVFNDEDGPAIAGPAVVQGSSTRGLVIHKLLEEVLTGETPETVLVDRAGELLGQLGVAPADVPSEGPVPSEIAATVERALACPEIAEIRDTLAPELPVLVSSVEDTVETILTGVADAVATDGQGCHTVVVDWKSDVAANPKRREHYRSQLRDYINALGAQRGLVAYVTEGSVEQVAAG
jgi:exodeoxyribonuclease-5